MPDVPQLCWWACVHQSHLNAAPGERDLTGIEQHALNAIVIHELGSCFTAFPVYCQSHFAYLSLVLYLKCVDLSSPSLAQQPALSCLHTQPLPLASLSLLLQSQLILQALHLR